MSTVNLARKYATAFLNQHGSLLSLADCATFVNAQEFIKKHPHFLFLLQLPVLPKNIQQKNLDEFFAKTSLNVELKQLCNLLIDHKRLALLPELLSALKRLYLERNNIMEFTISSSHALTAQQLEDIITYLHAQTGKKIIYNNYVDKNLIAGIRLQNNTYLWEFSIERQLREINQPLKYRGMYGY